MSVESRRDEGRSFLRAERDPADRLVDADPASTVVSHLDNASEDRPGSAAQNRSDDSDKRDSQPLMRWVLTPILLVTLISAILGYTVAALQPSRYVASATVLVRPDPSLLEPAPSVSAETSDRFVQSQVIALQDLNAASTGSPSQAQIEVNQVGLTDIVQITASSHSPTAAVNSANSLLTTYVTGRTDEVSAQAKAATEEAGKQLRGVTVALEKSDSITAKTRAANAALGVEYGRLVALMNQIRLTAVDAAPATVLHEAKAADVSKVSSKYRYAVLVGLLGGLIATAILRWSRRAVGRPSLAVLWHSRNRD